MQDSFKSMETNITSRFKKLSPDNYCNITDYKIFRVVDGKSKKDVTTWEKNKLFSLKEGMLKIETSKIIYTNYLIYVRPYNNYIWAWEDEDDWPDTFHVADITIYERPIQPPNPLPIFN
jgi:hypothetical protein